MSAAVMRYASANTQRYTGSFKPVVVLCLDSMDRIVRDGRWRTYATDGINPTYMAAKNTSWQVIPYCLTPGT